MRQDATRRGRLALWLSLLAAVCLLSGCSGKSVAKVSNEIDANEIMDVLKENGFDVDKEEVGEGEAKRWSVVINEGLFGGSDASLAIQVLRDQGLPRPDDIGREGIYKEQGMFQSEADQQAKRINELKTEIERQLRMLPGVTRVNVTVVLSKDDPIELRPYPATAGVLIIHKDAKPAFTGEQVQNLVARGVPNLKPENVNVSLSQQPPRVIPRQDSAMRRRNNIALAVGGGLVVVLGILLAVLWIKTRRQRAQLAALREGDEQDLEQDWDEEGALLEVPGTEHRTGKIGDATKVRRIAGADN